MDPLKEPVTTVALVPLNAKPSADNVPTTILDKFYWLSYQWPSLRFHNQMTFIIKQNDVRNQAGYRVDFADNLAHIPDEPNIQRSSFECTDNAYRRSP